MGTWELLRSLFVFRPIASHRYRQTNTDNFVASALRTPLVNKSDVKSRLKFEVLSRDKIVRKTRRHEALKPCANTALLGAVAFVCT